MTKNTLFLIATLTVLPMLSSVTLDAQTAVPEGYELVDSIIYRPAAVVDSSLVGKNIFHDMPSRNKGADADVTIYQSSDISGAMAGHIRSNADRHISGYRVRIFFDNRQTARAESEAALKKFESIFHDVSAYRSYANPYFKVTVGDFRTKSEAMELLERIRHEFPSAFVVREDISFPVVDRNRAYVVDTVRILRPAAKRQ